MIFHALMACGIKFRIIKFKNFKIRLKILNSITKLLHSRYLILVYYDNSLTHTRTESIFKSENSRCKFVTKKNSKEDEKLAKILWKSILFVILRNIKVKTSQDDMT